MTTKKVQEVLDMLAEGKSVKEICAETGASQPYVYTIKRNHSKPPEKKENDNDYEMTGDEENELNDFVKKIKIKPDPDVLTGNKDDDKKKEGDTEEYQCGACGGMFQGDKGTFQRYCPHCGVELG